MFSQTQLTLTNLGCRSASFKQLEPLTCSCCSSIGSAGVVGGLRVALGCRFGVSVWRVALGARRGVSPV